MTRRSVRRYGLYLAMQKFQSTRPAIAAGAIGRVAMALDSQLPTRRAQAFGTITATIRVQFLLSDRKSEHSGRLELVQPHGRRLGHRDNLEVAIAKIFTSDNAANNEDPCRFRR